MWHLMMLHRMPLCGVGCLTGGGRAGRGEGVGPGRLDRAGAGGRGNAAAGRAGVVRGDARGLGSPATVPPAVGGDHRGPVPGGAPVRGVHRDLAVGLDPGSVRDVGRAGVVGVLDGAVLPGCGGRVPGIRLRPALRLGRAVPHSGGRGPGAGLSPGQHGGARRRVRGPTGFRDSTLFKVIYGWGLRRREAAMLEVEDFTANPAAPELGRLGVVAVRYGKAMRGSPPRRRTVATVMPWTGEALEQYLTEVRPRYQAAGTCPAVWLTERGQRISPRSVDDRFAAVRAAAGLPTVLSVHCLRHSYVSHLIEDGVDPLFVQQQVGHSWASTTAVYTSVGTDAKNRMLRAALAPAFGNTAAGQAPGHPHRGEGG